MEDEEGHLLLMAECVTEGEIDWQVNYPQQQLELIRRQAKRTLAHAVAVSTGPSREMLEYLEAQLMHALWVLALLTQRLQYALGPSAEAPLDGVGEA